ncbi:MAG: polyprenyl diphosphate synthase [Gemmatimonadales bacterium]
MATSTLNIPAIPGHVAIILDGNGRWATARGLERSAGHRAGVEAVRRVVEEAPGLGISTLTLYAFSSDNWRRPVAETTSLFGLLENYLRLEAVRLAANGIRLSVIGRRDRMPLPAVAAVRLAERVTAAGRRLHLRIAIDYSARESILRAAARTGGRPLTLERFSRLLGTVDHSPAAAPEVDLLIRTGGEQRLSDFLLWESAYAELLFTSIPWPDFRADHLAAAIEEFGNRQRRFGALPELPEPISRESA